MYSIPAIENLVCNTSDGGEVTILEQPTPYQSQPPRPVMEPPKPTQAICLSRFILNTIIFKITLF
jgi:hypothetical protein